MKRITYIICLLTFLVACKDKTKFIINGKIENPGTEKKIYLYGMGSMDMTVLDSTTLSDKGEFKFTNVSPEANFYRINIGTNEYMLVAENGDELEFSADLNNSTGNFKLKGGKEAEKLVEFNDLRAKYTANLEKIKADFDQKVEANPEHRDELIKAIQPSYMKAVDDLNHNVIQFAQNNSNSLVSFYAISMVNPTGNEEAMVKYADKVSENVKKNPAVKVFVERITKMKSVQVGSQAPDFTINSLAGSPVKLADYKGKYVLLDFWASWCGPCRNENPNVVNAYNTYKNRNFTILGISLDKDKAAWQQAIRQDGLLWDHASELADFNGETVKLYQVQAIPSSFLLDPNGKIIARDLRGDELHAFLNKVLPQP